MALSGCRDEASQPPNAAPDVVYRRFVAVEAARPADSGAAVALRDTLRAHGWIAYLRSDRAGAGWSVRIAPSQNLAWAEVTAAALHATRPRAAVVHDSGTVEAQGIAGFTRVSYASQGMITRLRWMTAPDGDALLVMEDAAAIENDPAPNGFVLASEPLMRSVQMDSVWDAAPAPDWRSAVVGRAHVLRGGRADTLPTAQWDSLASDLGLPAADLRRAAFPASGMSIMFAVARLGTVSLEPPPGRPSADSQAHREFFPVLAGWRVAWSPNGDRLFAGTAPARVRDDSPAAAWVAVDLDDGEVRAEEAPPEDARDRWTEGPTIDISVAVDMERTVTLPLAGGDTLSSRDGWIRLGQRIVGPGRVLAATRTARYVLALAPNPSAGEGEPRHMAVVYMLGAEPVATLP